MGHSCFTAHVQPALVGAPCAAPGKGKTINLPEPNPALSWSWLHWEHHLPALLQGNISCDKSNSLIVVDDVTCNWNGEGDVNRECWEDFPTSLHFMSFSTASPDIPLAGKCTRAPPAKPLQPSGIRATILMKSAHVDFLGKQKQNIESKQPSKIEWCNGKLIILIYNLLYIILHIISYNIIYL